MSTEQDKFKNSKRRQKDENAVKKQLKIATEQNHINSEYNPKLNQPHRFAKHHAMDCGNPKCVLCGNPRKTWHQLTTQEKRQFQEMDITRLRHSNGLLIQDISNDRED